MQYCRVCSYMIQSQVASSYYPCYSCCSVSKFVTIFHLVLFCYKFFFAGGLLHFFLGLFLRLRYLKSSLHAIVPRLQLYDSVLGGFFLSPMLQLLFCFAVTYLILSLSKHNQPIREIIMAISTKKFEFPFMGKLRKHHNNFQ